LLRSHDGQVVLRSVAKGGDVGSELSNLVLHRVEKVDCKRLMLGCELWDGVV
jgi:hypothetical protein